MNIFHSEALIAEYRHKTTAKRLIYLTHVGEPTSQAKHAECVDSKHNHVSLGATFDQ